MKILIVFLGLLVVNISFLTYQGDMGRYVQSQVYLKALAEECAAGASLYYDEEEYAEGRMVFDSEDGRYFTEYLLERSKKRMPLPKTSRITYSISYEDDLRGYEEDEASANHDVDDGNQKNPSVTVKLTADTEDLFRLSFLNLKQVSRTAKYELPAGSSPAN